MTVISNDILTGLSGQHLLTRSDGFMLHKAVGQPYIALCAAAKLVGIEIKIVSAFRSYQRQQAIWLAKFSGTRPVFNQDGQLIDVAGLNGKAKLDAILLYSALPGASRHHWGTDLDIYDAAAVPPDYQPQLDPAEYGPNGPFHHLRQWLSANAETFDFFMPYREFQGGVAPEPWHLSYQPIARQYLAQMTPALLRRCLEQHPIAGQPLVLQHLDSIFHQYVSNICGG